MALLVEDEPCVNGAEDASTAAALALASASGARHTGRGGVTHKRSARGRCKHTRFVLLHVHTPGTVAHEEPPDWCSLLNLAQASKQHARDVSFAHTVAPGTFHDSLLPQARRVFATAYHRVCVAITQLAQTPDLGDINRHCLVVRVRPRRAIRRRSASASPGTGTGAGVPVISSCALVT